MTTPTWPSELPAHALQGSSFTPIDPVIRTEPEMGPVRARQRFTVTPDNAPRRWLFTKEQFARFETFHRYEINNGAAPFLYPFSNGKGVTMCEARFISPFTAREIEVDKWEVTATLLIKNRPIDPPA